MKSANLFQRLVVSSIVVMTMYGSHIPVYGWGDQGHEIVGGIAMQRLHSKKAKDEIAAILGNENLRAVSTWGDSVKHASLKKLPKSLKDDKDSILFITQYPNKSGSWHFVDLPLQVQSYQDAGLKPPFIGDSEHPDIVMKIRECIAILKSDAKTEGAFGKRNALRMLVHLVGDIHQPLHVGCTFYDEDAKWPKYFFESNPAEILKRHLSSTVGGNKLFVREGGEYVQLHGYWDTDLVKNAVNAAVNAHRLDSIPGAKNAPYQAFATMLANQKAPAAWSKGSKDDWPVRWTNDALPVARVAYRNVRVSSTKQRKFMTPYSKDPVSGYTTTLPSGYRERMTPVVEEQLAKGGYRLAKLLDSIWPDN